MRAAAIVIGVTSRRAISMKEKADPQKKAMAKRMTTSDIVGFSNKIHPLV